MKYLLSILPLLVIIGCSDKGSGATGAGGAAADVGLDACEHLEGGPFVEVDASDDPASAPDVSASHTGHRITLVDDGSGMYGGHVSFAADEAGELLLFVDGPVALAVFDSGGDALALETTPGCPGDACVSSCDLVKNHVAVDIELVGTYGLALGPSAAPLVTLVQFEAAHHHDH